MKSPKDETLPPWRFHAFEMPDGQKFIAWFHGKVDQLEIDTVAGQKSLGRIEDKAEWIGLTGEVIFPVRGADK